VPPFHFHVHVGSGGDILITDLFASKKVEMEVVAAAISVFFCSIFFEKNLSDVDGLFVRLEESGNETGNGSDFGCRVLQKIASTVEFAKKKYR